MKGKLPGDHHWLHELEYCQHIDCAETALEQELRYLKNDVGKKLPQLVVGFLYLRFLQQELTLCDLESEIVDVVDGSHVVGMDVEHVRMTLPNLASNLIFRQVLDGLANESMNHLHQVEAMTM